MFSLIAIAWGYLGYVVRMTVSRVSSCFSDRIVSATVYWPSTSPRGGMDCKDGTDGIFISVTREVKEQVGRTGMIMPNLLVSIWDMEEEPSRLEVRYLRLGRKYRVVIPIGLEPIHPQPHPDTSSTSNNKNSGAHIADVVDVDDDGYNFINADAGTTNGTTTNKPRSMYPETTVPSPIDWPMPRGSIGNLWGLLLHSPVEQATAHFTYGSVDITHRLNKYAGPMGDFYRGADVHLSPPTGAWLFPGTSELPRAIDVEMAGHADGALAHTFFTVQDMQVLMPV